MDAPRQTSPRPKAPRKARPDRRAEIAAAALTCLCRDGYASLTARKVAAEAGLSLGHLTYSFASMDEVLSEAYRLASDRLQAATAEGMAQAGEDPWDRFAAFLAAGFAPSILDPAYLRMRVDLWSAALAHPGIAATERALYTRYRAALETHLAAIAAPSRAARIPTAADAIMALLDGLWLDYLRRADMGAVTHGLRACQTLARAELTDPAPPDR